MRRVNSVCVFCGSNPGNDPRYVEVARELGAEIARRGQRLVYGGASVGLMGAVADAALASGGEVLGVIPESLVSAEVAHHGLTELRVTRSMHERKQAMAESSDGFAALPGGYGTFEELFEIITWRQLDFHDKPIGVLDVGGFYAPLVDLVDGAVQAGFIREGHRGLIASAEDPAELLDEMQASVKRNRPKVTKWVEKA